jgi:endonuclease/exonuclease/phosphatase family metal-dependent hydrolase
VNIFFILLGAFLFYLLAVVLVNRNKMPDEKISLLNAPKNLNEKFDTNISILTWNIGYAGLGKESDFTTDGGKSFFPPSRKIVKKNLNGIEKILKSQKSDIFLLQEVSDSSPLSFLVPVRKRIISLFPNFLAIFRGDIASKLLPYPFRVNHGVLSLAKANIKSSDIVTLPLEPTLMLGLLRRRYGLLVSRFAIKNSDKLWVVVNLHLAAFDENGATRQKQFDRVFAFAQKEYEKGNHVVLGGDWNMELAKSNFPHETDKKHFFWHINFPTERLLKGWQIGVDKTTPTVRSNNKPYVKGENYTLIIDGYIVSPNVNIEQVKTIDTDFECTDHLPIVGIFSTK